MYVHTAATDFGQSDFGHPYWPTLANSDFGQTDFGQKNDRLWPTLIGRLWPNLPRRVGPRRVGPRRVGGPNLEKVGPRRVGSRRVGPRRVGPRRVGPRRVGPRRVGGPNLEKVGPRRVGPRRVGPRRVGSRKVGPPKGGGPKISRFFFPFPPPFRSHCVSLGVFSWNFGGVLKRRCPQMCTLGVLGLSCASPGRAPAFENTTKIPREDPRETQ